MSMFMRCRSVCSALLRGKDGISFPRPISSTVNGREEAVVVTDDGATIVCWHPEPPVPYHLTKPLPESAEVSNSILKVQNQQDLKRLFSKQHKFYAIQELTKLTYTNKHIWFPRPGRRFAKKNPPRDREYL